MAWNTEVRAAVLGHLHHPRSYRDFSRRDLFHFVKRRNGPERNLGPADIGHVVKHLVIEIDNFFDGMVHGFSLRG